MAWGGTEVKRPRTVSMKSGLEGRNNPRSPTGGPTRKEGLNEVRPRRPEQWVAGKRFTEIPSVSMKSGLEGRNNGWLGRGLPRYHPSQ